MKPSVALHIHRAAIRHIVASHRASNARVFGSVVRGEDMMDAIMDFDGLREKKSSFGTGGMIIMDKSTDIIKAIWRISAFFKHESCGQCTPCRVGTAKAARLMQALVWDAQMLEDLAEVMGDASICGLGQAAPNPIRSIQKYFANEVSEAVWIGSLPPPGEPLVNEQSVHGETK